VLDLGREGLARIRRARELLTEAGADVLYRESPLPHAVDPGFVRELGPWIESVLP
jgi:predicted esterase